MSNPGDVLKNLIDLANKFESALDVYDHYHADNFVVFDIFHINFWRSRALVGVLQNALKEKITNAQQLGIAYEKVCKILTHISKRNQNVKDIIINTYSVYLNNLELDFNNAFNVAKIKAKIVETNVINAEKAVETAIAAEAVLDVEIQIANTKLQKAIKAEEDMRRNAIQGVIAAKHNAERIAFEAIKKVTVQPKAVTQVTQTDATDVDLVDVNAEIDVREAKAAITQAREAKAAIEEAKKALTQQTQKAIENVAKANKTASDDLVPIYAAPNYIENFNVDIRDFVYKLLDPFLLSDLSKDEPLINLRATLHASLLMLHKKEYSLIDAKNVISEFILNNHLKVTYPATTYIMQEQLDKIYARAKVSVDRLSANLIPVHKAAFNILFAQNDKKNETTTAFFQAIAAVIAEPNWVPLDTVKRSIIDHLLEDFDATLAIALNGAMQVKAAKGQHELFANRLSLTLHIINLISSLKDSSMDKDSKLNEIVSNTLHYNFWNTVSNIEALSVADPLIFKLFEKIEVNNTNPNINFDPKTVEMLSNKIKEILMEVNQRQTMFEATENEFNQQETFFKKRYNKHFPKSKIISYATEFILITWIEAHADENANKQSIDRFSKRAIHDLKVQMSAKEFMETDGMFSFDVSKIVLDALIHAIHEASPLQTYKYNQDLFFSCGATIASQIINNSKETFFSRVKAFFMRLFFGKINSYTESSKALFRKDITEKTLRALDFLAYLESKEFISNLEKENFTKIILENLYIFLKTPTSNPHFTKNAITLEDYINILKKEPILYTWRDKFLGQVDADEVEKLDNTLLDRVQAVINDAFISFKLNHTSNSKGPDCKFSDLKDTISKVLKDAKRKDVSNKLVKQYIQNIFFRNNAPESLLEIIDDFGQYDFDVTATNFSECKEWCERVKPIENFVSKMDEIFKETLQALTFEDHINNLKKEPELYAWWDKFLGQVDANQIAKLDNTLLEAVQKIVTNAFNSFKLQHTSDGKVGFKFSDLRDPINKVIKDAKSKGVSDKLVKKYIQKIFFTNNAPKSLLKTLDNFDQYNLNVAASNFSERKEWSEQVKLMENFVAYIDKIFEGPLRRYAYSDGDYSNSAFGFLFPISSNPSSQCVTPSNDNNDKNFFDSQKVS